MFFRMSPAGGDNFPRYRHDKLSSSTSSTLSSSSSSSPSAPLLPTTPRASRTMEEVWKDIDLASLQEHHSNVVPGGAHTFRGTILQNFFARPQDRPAAAAQPAPPPLPPPATILSLHSGAEFVRFLDRSVDSPRQSPQPSHRVISAGFADDVGHHLDVLGPIPAPEELGFGNKRSSVDEGGSGDRRHKRMIKNRESAARSRARKQAYTTELEREVAQLMDENAMLRRQQQQLCMAASQLTKKPTLHRTSTAPF